jgi:Acyltransferase family
MKRLVCLDGLRGVLAVYVMLSHTMPFAPMPHWLHWLFQHGGAAVDVFFILSGLVIVESLASFEYRPLPFLIARVARIYPVFLAVFAFAVGIQPLATSFEHMAWIGQDSAARYLWSGGWPSDWALGIATHLTMTHGLFPDGFSSAIWVRFLGTAWSLSTEWQFYLLAGISISMGRCVLEQALVVIPAHLSPEHFDWTSSRPVEQWFAGPGRNQNVYWRPRDIDYVEVATAELTNICPDNSRGNVAATGMAAPESRQRERLAIPNKPGGGASKQAAATSAMGAAVRSGLVSFSQLQRMKQKELARLYPRAGRTTLVAAREEALRSLRDLGFDQERHKSNITPA